MCVCLCFLEHIASLNQKMVLAFKYFFSLMVAYSFTAGLKGFIFIL